MRINGSGDLSSDFIARGKRLTRVEGIFQTARECTDSKQWFFLTARALRTVALYGNVLGSCERCFTLRVAPQNRRSTQHVDVYIPPEPGAPDGARAGVALMA